MNMLCNILKVASAITLILFVLGIVIVFVIGVLMLAWPYAWQVLLGLWLLGSIIYWGFIADPYEV